MADLRNTSYWVMIVVAVLAMIVLNACMSQLPSEETAAQKITTLKESGRYIVKFSVREPDFSIASFDALREPTYSAIQSVSGHAVNDSRVIAVYSNGDSSDITMWVSFQDTSAVDFSAINTTLREQDSTNTNLKLEWIEPDYLINMPNVMPEVIPDVISGPLATPNDPLFEYQWALRQIRVSDAWSIPTNGANVVGVIDGGIHINHPDLVANIWTNPHEIDGDNVDNDGNGYVDDIHGIAPSTNCTPDLRPGGLTCPAGDPSSGDRMHGTHVAGTIAAVIDNEIGVAGISRQTKVIPCNIGATGYSVSSVIACLEYFRELKVDKHIAVVATNNSYGALVREPPRSLDDFIERQSQAGILFVAGAGNEAKDTSIDWSFWPASVDKPNVISVGSTDRNDARSGFSNWGLSSVDISAPGTDIVSTGPEEGYLYLNGTSMATPHVTGLAGLLSSINPQYTWANLKNLMFTTGDTLTWNTPTLTNRRINAATASRCREQTFSYTPALSFNVVALALGDTWQVAFQSLECEQPKLVEATVTPAGGSPIIVPSELKPDQSGELGFQTINVPTQNVGKFDFRIESPTTNFSYDVIEPPTALCQTTYSYFDTQNLNPLPAATDGVVTVPFKLPQAGTIPLNDTRIQVRYDGIIGIEGDGVLVDPNLFSLEEKFPGRLVKPFGLAISKLCGGSATTCDISNSLPAGRYAQAFVVNADGVDPNQDGRALIVEWDGVARPTMVTCPIVRLKFQAVMFENSPDIIFNYEQVQDFNLTCTPNRALQIGFRPSVIRKVTATDTLMQTPRDKTSLLVKSAGSQRTCLKSVHLPIIQR